MSPEVPICQLAQNKKYWTAKPPDNQQSSNPSLAQNLSKFHQGRAKCPFFLPSKIYLVESTRFTAGSIWAVNHSANGTFASNNILSLHSTTKMSSTQNTHLWKALHEMLLKVKLRALWKADTRRILGQPIPKEHLEILDGHMLFLCAGPPLTWALWSGITREIKISTKQFGECRN